jgi:predicted nucleic acid-binding protein
MRFWDSSALVALCLAQPRTKAARAAVTADPELVVWWGSSVECASAIARLAREDVLSTADESAARALLDTLRGSWFEVQPGEALRAQAMRLLRLHPLRAADALQLAAAIEWSGSPASGHFITFDERLKRAAEREGFSVTA